MKTISPVTIKELLQIKSEGFTALGGVSGLYLRISGGSKLFVYRYKSPITGKRSMVTVGSMADMTLGDARVKAGEFRELVIQGIDPAIYKKEQRESVQRALVEKRVEANAKKYCFKELANMWLDERIKSGYYDKNVRGAPVVRAYLDRNINPVIGHISIGELTHRDVFNVMKDLWVNTTSAKDKCLRIVSQVYRWAQAMDYVSGDNPADIKGPLGVLLGNLSPVVKQSKNYPALAVEEMPEFFRELMQIDTAGARALAFSILTASRSKPVRNAKWSDIDLDEKTWACPEESMKVKGRGAFVVLLSNAAVELLKRCPKFDGVDYIFPSPYKLRPLTDAGLGKVITDMHVARLEAQGKGWVDPAQSEVEGYPVKVTQHGTARATFKTWSRTGKNLKRFDTDAVELCLAHKVDDKYDGAYDRASLIEERRKVMEAWGEYCVSMLEKK